MPRLSTHIIREARNIDPRLPLLLRACRDLPSARNELRWLREHLADLQRRKPGLAAPPTLTHLCRRRSIGAPLQYILRSQPFGDLDICCRPGVLIPRPETESYTTHLADLLGRHLPSETSKIRILDLCSGSGCIALLLYQRLSLRLRRLEVVGLDNEPRAVGLARRNTRRNVRLGHLPPHALDETRFERCDILDEHAQSALEPPWDILISNPPYISHRGFDVETTKSVRNFEPIRALKAEPRRADGFARSVNDDSSGDRFYLAIMSWAYRLHSQIVVLEVGSGDQAWRVLRQVRLQAPRYRERWPNVEIWNDDPSFFQRFNHEALTTTDGVAAKTGTLHESSQQRNQRALVFSTNNGSSWLGRTA